MACVGADRRARVEPAELAEECFRLVLLVGDDVILTAPPDLKRDPRGGDLVRKAEGAARGVGRRDLGRRPAELAPHHRLEVDAARLAVAVEACLIARDGRQLRVSARKVGDRIHRGRAGQDLGVARDEQQRLLAAHAAPEREHASPIDPEPRKRFGDELRHPGEIVDLPLVAVGEVPEAPAHPVGIDDREPAETGEVAPVPRVRTAGAGAAVRRDHERERRAVAGGAVGRGHDDLGRPLGAVVRGVGDRPGARQWSARLGRPCGLSHLRRRRHELFGGGDALGSDEILRRCDRDGRDGGGDGGDQCRGPGGVREAGGRARSSHDSEARSGSSWLPHGRQTAH
jgi:hypothetical protein